MDCEFPNRHPSRQLQKTTGDAPRYAVMLALHLQSDWHHTPDSKPIFNKNVSAVSAIQTFHENIHSKALAAELAEANAARPAKRKA